MMDFVKEKRKMNPRWLQNQLFEKMKMQLGKKKRSEPAADAIKESERKFASCLLLYFVTTRQKMLDMTKVLCEDQGEDAMGCKIAKQETARQSKLHFDQCLASSAKTNKYGKYLRTSTG